MPEQNPIGAIQSILGAAPPRSMNIGQDDSQMRQDLNEKFSKMEDEYRRYNSNKIISKNKAEDSRVQALREALQMLQQAGIDPNDPEQIRAFMDALAERNPDLLIMFEDAMNILLGGGQSQEQIQGAVQQTQEVEQVQPQIQPQPEQQMSQQMPMQQ